jgi:hypothetical protein
MDKDLQQAIRSFKSQHKLTWSTPERALNMCDFASDEFAKFLRRQSKNHKPNVQVIHCNKGNHVYARWYAARRDKRDLSEDHMVVFIQDFIIDWTARQYNVKAPYPFVFMPKRRKK